MYNGPGSNVSDAAPYSPLSTASAAELSLRPSGCYPISDAPSSNIPIMWLDDEVREDDPTVLPDVVRGFRSGRREHCRQRTRSREQA